MQFEHMLCTIGQFICDLLVDFMIFTESHKSDFTQIIAVVFSVTKDPMEKKTKPLSLKSHSGMQVIQ